MLLKIKKKKFNNERKKKKQNKKAVKSKAYCFEDAYGKL